MHWVSLKHFLQKFSKYTAKLEEFYNDPLYIYHLDFTINIFFDKASHNVSIRMFLYLLIYLIFEAFQILLPNHSVSIS